MAVTGAQLARRALARLGKVGQGQTVAPGIQKDVVEQLSLLLDRWNRKGLTLAVGVRSPYATTANVGTYTIGPSGATLTGPRPTTIESAAWMATGSTFEHALVVLTRQQWQRQADKALTTTLPRAVRYEPSAPSGTLYILDTPSVVGTVVLYHKTILTRITNPATAYSFPEGFELALEANLAKQIAPILGAALSDDNRELAATTLGELMAGIEGDQVPLLSSDPAILGPGVWNWQTGEPD